VAAPAADTDSATRAFRTAWATKEALPAAEVDAPGAAEIRNWSVPAKKVAAPAAEVDAPAAAEVSGEDAA
jgi:hypothetical protein